jgi:hypothetical protein
MGALITNDYVDEQLVNQATGSATTTPSILNSATLGLCSITLGLTRTTTLAALTAGEPGYAGYARKPITWTAAARDGGGLIQSLGTVPEFRPTNATVPATIFCIFGVLSNGSLGFCASLDRAPISLADQFSNLVVTLAWKPTSGGLESNLP